MFGLPEAGMRFTIDLIRSHGEFNCLTVVSVLRTRLNNTTASSGVSTPIKNHCWVCTSHIIRISGTAQEIGIRAPEKCKNANTHGEQMQSCSLGRDVE